MADEATLDKFRDLTSVSSKLILPVIQLHLFSCEVKNGVQMNNAEICACVSGRAGVKNSYGIRPLSFRQLHISIKLLRILFKQVKKLQKI